MSAEYIRCSRWARKFDTILTQFFALFVVVWCRLETIKNKTKPLEILTFSVFPRVIEFGRSDGT